MLARHMHIRLNIFGLLAAAITWHGAMADPSKSSIAYIENFSCDHGQFGLRLPLDAGALSQLGPVLERRIGEVEQWGGYRATRNYVRYPGMDLGYVAFSDEPQRYLISYVEVTGPDWQISRPFKIRDPVSAVRGIFGEAAKDDSGLNRSYGSEAGTVTFDQVNGKITKIRYGCYTG